MRCSTPLAKLICAVTSVRAVSVQVVPSFNAQIGNENVDDIAGIEYRLLEVLDTSFDSGWEVKTIANADGFTIASSDIVKAGYRFTGDDETAIVWEYDSSISDNLGSATWDAIDTSVDEPLILYNNFFSAIFPNATSLPGGDDKKRQAASDIWDNGPYISAPLSGVQVQAGQETCPTAQNITLTAVDAEGNFVVSSNSINFASMTIPEDTAYPVTITGDTNVGTVNITLSNVLPIKFTLGDGANAPTQTLEYVLEIDFCPSEDD